MPMNQVLDSSSSFRDSDKRLCLPKRPASHASLPTPPRTRHKGNAKRIERAKTTHDNNGSDNNDLSEDESPQRKKCRTIRVLPGHGQDEDDENGFWTGRVGPSGKERIRSQLEARSPSPGMLRYRVKAPVSPPPSRGYPLIQPTVERENSSTESVAPVTPPRRLPVRGPFLSAAGTVKTPKSKATKVTPKRDSPDNPFLGPSSKDTKLRSEWDSSDEAVDEARIQEGALTSTYDERPTITYVFRGQKATFRNPLYGLAPEMIAASKLHIEHPDFEATEACPPRRLFSSGKRDRSRENISAEGAKRVKFQWSENDCDTTSASEPRTARTESHKELSHAESTEAGTIPSKAT